MSAMNRPIALGLALAASLGFLSTARASYDYTSGVTPGEIETSNSVVQFIAALGRSIAVDGSAHPTTLLGMFSGTPNPQGIFPDLPTTLFTDLLTITDGGKTGTFTITFDFQATNLTLGGGTFTMTNVSLSSNSIVVNGDTYTLSNVTLVPPLFDPPPSTHFGSINATLAATPSAVPEPTALALVGLGGVAMLVARRLKAPARQPDSSAPPALAGRVTW